MNNYYTLFYPYHLVLNLPMFLITYDLLNHEDKIGYYFFAFRNGSSSSTM